MNKKIGVKWLNFLYSFFAFEVVFKGLMAIGTISTFFEKKQEFEESSFITFDNAVAFCTIALILAEIYIKLMACIYNTKRKEGYTYITRGFIWGPISSSFYVFFDQGLETGLVFMVFDILLNLANYLYVRKRKEIYGNLQFLYN